MTLTKITGVLTLMWAILAPQAQATPVYRVGDAVPLTVELSVTVLNSVRTRTLELQGNWTAKPDEGSFVSVNISVKQNIDGAVDWTNWNQSLYTWDGRERVLYSLSPVLERQGGNTPLYGFAGDVHFETLVFDIGNEVQALGVYLRPGKGDLGILVNFA